MEFPLQSVVQLSLFYRCVSASAERVSAALTTLRAPKTEDSIRSRCVGGKFAAVGRIAWRKAMRLRDSNHSPGV